MTETETAEQLVLLARHLLLHGNADDAFALLASAIQLTPDDPAALALHCEAAHRSGHNEEAHERLQVLLPLVSDEQRRTLSDLDARVLLALGRRREAEAAYRRMRPLEPAMFDPVTLDPDR